MQPTSPTVSVIIPCYNQGRYLSQAIDSLKAQTLSDWECIVVNDGSKDNSAEVAKACAQSDSRIRVIEQPNRGPSAARNRGVAEARGGYLQFLDADDLLEREKFLCHVSHLEKFAEDGIVYGDVRYFTDENPTQYFYGIWGEDGPWVAELAASKTPLLLKVLFRNVMAMNCPMFRKSVIDRVGPFDESIRGCEDWDYWIQCAVKGVRFSFVAASGTLALVRSHEASSSRDLTRMLEGEYLFRLKIAKYLNTPMLRRHNFEAGASRLEQLNPPDLAARLWKLAKANASPRVYAYAALRVLDKHHRLRTFARAVRGSTRVATPQSERVVSRGGIDSAVDSPHP